MIDPISILIHPSQFPDAVQRELQRCLRQREVNHKFHYESYKQVSKWLALHEEYSPARTDPECAVQYDAAFAVSARLTGRAVHVIGLGAGGGQKDHRLLQLLAEQKKTVNYSPLDVSAPMVVTAALAVKPVVHHPTPIVADLAEASDLPAVFDKIIRPDAARLYTFFGMIPNFEPERILPRLADMIPVGARLLFSANLAPGSDYRRGIEQIQPLYDNELTRDWLLTFMLDLGFEMGDGRLVWQIEGERFVRLTAGFELVRDRTVVVSGERFAFRKGERIRLFFSYRYTPALVGELLQEHGFEVTERWITRSEEEGIFLCERA
jgi:uncharacterized SAM-dependent methyltransferase